MKPAAKIENWRATSRALMAQHYLFGDLGPETLDAILSRAAKRDCAAGEVLFLKGDAGTSLMGVLAGRIKISVHSADGKEIVLNMLGAGSIFGEIALLDGKERTADATAMEPTSLVVLERRDFLPFIERHPAIATRLMALLCERLRWVSDLYEEMIFLNLPARLARRTMRLMDRFGARGGAGAAVDLKISQQELGNIAGATREAVNKVLRDWEEQELIRLARNRVTVLKPDELLLIADGP